MADKRMFNTSVVGSDSFMEMPDSAQNLYFHLSMYADDDGFVDKWKQIMRMTGKKEDDIKILIAKSFIIPFDSGVIVIKHWRLNNYIRNDRYKETVYLAEKSQLTQDKKGEYTFGIPNDNQVVYQMDTQYSIDKISVDKISIEKEKINKKEKTISDTHNQKVEEPKKSDKPKKDCVEEKKKHFAEFVTMTDVEYEKLVNTYGKEFADQCITRLDNYKGANGKKYKSDYRAILNWVVERETEEQSKKNARSTSISIR